MNSELNSYLSQKAPQWMRDMFEELEELFPDTDKLNLEEMQQRLDENSLPPAAAHVCCLVSLERTGFAGNSTQGEY
jgi:hypothetical protein